MKKDDVLSFLTEDFKDTSTHLRETDRKLSTWTQIYGGSILVLATISTTLIDNQLQITPEQAFFAHIFVLLFTWWLFLFSLKCMETKKIYLGRMNFLRHEIHKFAKTFPPKLKRGYWSDVENDSSNNLSERRSLGKVGLDELYPFGLIFILTMLVALLPYTANPFLMNMLRIDFSGSSYGLLLAVLVGGFTYIRFNKAKEEGEREKGNLWGAKGKGPLSKQRTHRRSSR